MHTTFSHKIAAPLSTLVLLLALIIIPHLGQARTVDSCLESRGTTTCERRDSSQDTATSTDPVDDTGGNDGTDDTATSTDPVDDTDTASTTPPTDDTASTSTDDGTDTEDNTNNNGGGSGGDDNESAKVSVRDKDGIMVSLNQSFTPGKTVSITPTDGNPAVAVNSASVLALLVALDERSSAFSISDLQYYPSFDAFFLNCIKADGTELCGQWQYTINGNYPSVGLDQYIVDADDSVFLFYGSPRTVEVARQVAANTEFTATAFEYNTDADEYQPLSGYTIGVIQENPDNPWSPHEIATAQTNKNGEAVFTVDTVGEYMVGLKEDYYSPSTDFEVVETLASSGGSGGSSNSTNNESTIDINAALAFLLAHQSADGSFGAPLYSDWATIALASLGTNEEALQKVRTYLTNTDGSSIHITDHERRAMALMAVGVSPYDGTRINHIATIVDSFDGTQVGLENEINDDIFALIVLHKAGYTENDEIIQKLIAHVVAKQNDNGSWGASVDMTAAGIMALAPLSGDPVVTARAKARNHLKASQKDDAGFGNTFSTSWALMAIAALNETPQQWVKYGITPLDSLKNAQQSDGGFEETTTPDTNRLWATAYAVPAANGHSWLDIIEAFPRPSVLGEEVDTGDTADDIEEHTPIALTTTSFAPTPARETSSNNAATPAGSTAFRFASDGSTPKKAENTTAVSATEKNSRDSVKSDESATEEASRSFFSRFFSKIRSIIFFWR